MYSHLRREDISDHKKLITPNVTSNLTKLKPSPTSGDESTKGESTQNTCETSGLNHPKFARKKSGLKPIRPVCVSGSSLHPTTPGRFPVTPRMSFKENDTNSRFGQLEFPSTPKFLRSESTPELRRTKKFDYLMQSTEKNNTLFKSQNILQETSVSNLASLTSDLLPDIFRKPITQQPDTPFNPQLKVSNEERVSKWGYGPSDCHTKPSQNDSVREAVNKYQTEEKVNCDTPKISSKFAKTSTDLQFDRYSFNQSARSSALTSLNPKPSVQENSTTNSLTTSSTASHMLPTVKVLDFLSTPKVDPVVAGRPTPPLIFTKVDNNQPPPVVVHQKSPETLWANKPELIKADPSSTLLQQLLPSKQEEKTVENLPPHGKAISETVPETAQQMLAPACAPPVHPLTRAPPRAKQISVNGKIYSVMKPLGRGGSSVVYQVLNSEMTDIFALKVVRLDSVDEETAEGYINEVRLLKQLQGLTRVVRLIEYEYNVEEEKLLLVMEKGDTDFASVIRSRSSLNAVNPTLVRFYWQEMLEAVGSIHDKNVIHSDLKPANFLLVNGGLKLIDFGIATSIQADMTSIMKENTCGTYNYMAPEAIKSSSPVGANQEFKISRKTDVWSLGCILYNLIYKNPPFNKFRDSIEKLNAIVDERYKIEFPPTADPFAVSVLKGCLDRNPRNRPSIEELLLHPYLNYNNPINSSVNFNDCSSLKSQLEPFMKDGKLTDEAKELIRQWL